MPVMHSAMPITFGAVSRSCIQTEAITAEKSGEVAFNIAAVEASMSRSAKPISVIGMATATAPMNR